MHGIPHLDLRFRQVLDADRQLLNLGKDPQKYFGAPPYTVALRPPFDVFILCRIMFTVLPERYVRL